MQAQTHTHLCRTAYVQSSVGVGTLDVGLLNVGMAQRGRQERPAVVQWDGRSYLVGAGVERFATPVERMDLLRLSGSDEVLALTHKTLFDLLHTGVNPSVALMVGMPVEVMADAERAKQVRADLRAQLEGAHSVQVDGQSLTYTIATVQLMAQPAGTFFAWGFDDTGHWTRNAADQKALTAVCDIGFNTLDLFTVQGGQVQARFTGGDSLGMRRAAELLIRTVRHDHGFGLSRQEADALLRERNPVYMTAGTVVELRAIVAQARAANAGAVLSFLEEKWGNGRQFGHVLFTGGGAEALRDELLRNYPHGYVMPEAVMANALGLARAAARMLRRFAPFVVGLDPGYGGFKAVVL